MSARDEGGERRQSPDGRAGAERARKLKGLEGRNVAADSGLIPPDALKMILLFKTRRRIRRRDTIGPACEAIP